MATKIRDLFVALGIKADTRSLAKFDAGVNKARAGMAALAKAATIATVAVVGLAVSTAVAGDEFAKSAKQLGVGVEELQELTFAADRSGASMADLRVGIRRLAVTARDAATGSKIAADAFALLGISATDSEGNLKGTADLFEEVAGGLAGMENETQKMALANDLFGRSGAKLLPLLNEGADGIAELRKQAREYGLVMSKDAARASEEFVDTMTDAKAVLSGLKNTIGLALMPVIQDVIKGFTEWFIVNKELVQSKTREWAERLASAASRLADFLILVGTALDKIGIDNFITGMTILAGLWTTFRGAQVVIGTMEALGAAFGITTGAAALIAAKVLAVIAAIVLLGLAIEDLIVFFQGGDSAIGQFIEDNKKAAGAVGLLARSLEWVLDVVKQFGDAVEFGEWLDGVSRAVDATADRLSNLFGDGPTVGATAPSSASSGAQSEVLRQQQARLAAAQASQSGGSTTSNTSSSQSFTAGDINISGVSGMTLEEAARVTASAQATQQRQAATAFSTGAI